MAIPLDVPVQFQGGLAKIHDLDNESVRALVLALQQIPNTYDQDAITRSVGEKLDTTPADDVEQIISTLVSLYLFRDFRQAAILDVAEGVTEAVQGKTEKPFEHMPRDRKAYTDRMVRLLSVEQMNTVMRALILTQESEHSWRNVRILTDVRPVFDPESSDAPARGAVILHTLKIGYTEDNRTKEFFVMLDTDEIDELQEQIQRAKAKATSLETLLKDVPHIKAK